MMQSLIYKDDKEIVVHLVKGGNKVVDVTACSMAVARYLILNQSAIIYNFGRNLILIVKYNKFSYPEIPYKSKCCVCGSYENPTWHHIVPAAYMKYGTSRYKRKSSFFDIEILCSSCHDAYENSVVNKKELQLLRMAGQDEYIEEREALKKARAKVSLAKYEGRFLIPDEKFSKQFAEEIGLNKTTQSSELMKALDKKLMLHFRSDRYNNIKVICENLDWDTIRNFWVEDFNNFFQL